MRKTKQKQKTNTASLIDGYYTASLQFDLEENFMGIKIMQGPYINIELCTSHSSRGNEVVLVSHLGTLEEQPRIFKAGEL